MADFKACGWTTLFQMGGKGVSLPEELTAKWWDKKKGTAAKIKGGVKGGTGMGEALEKLQAVFKKMETDFVFLSPAPNAVKTDIVNADKFIKSAKVKALRDELKTVRDLAKEQAKEMKSSILTKKTGEVLDEIYSTADYIFVATNDQSLRESLKTAVSLWKEQIAQKLTRLAEPTLNLAKKVIEKLPRAQGDVEKLLKAYEENPNKKADIEKKEVGTREAFGDAYRTLCRDMTQPLTNLLKMKNNGTPFENYDEAGINNLGKAMEKVGNSKGLEFMDDVVDPKAARKMFDEMKVWCTSYTNLVQDIAIMQV
jgi:hypothetical protein